MRAASAVILRLRCRRIGARRRILRAEHFQYRTDGAREGRDHDGVSRVRVVEQAARGANIFRFARSKLCCAPEFEFDFALGGSQQGLARGYLGEHLLLARLLLGLIEHRHRSARFQ